jgi:hypothetical protein
MNATDGFAQFHLKASFSRRFHGRDRSKGTQNFTLFGTYPPLYMLPTAWTLARGPPWARETAETNEQLVAAVVVLGAVVVVLCVVVAYLWRQQSAGERPPPGAESTETVAETEQMSEFDRIKQIDATVEQRLPQQEIVERTDWSEPKVSRVVSRLTDEGRLEKVRVGRRNFIEIAEPEEPDTAQAQSEDAAKL